MGAFGMSDIDRKRVLLAQHQRVADLASMARAAAGAVLCAEEPVPAWHLESLELAIEALAVQIEAHLDTEEALLRPVLWEMGPWGRFRFDMLRAEHVQQRATLLALRSERSGIETYRRARKAASLAEEIARDIAVEERDLFAVVFPASENVERTAAASERFAEAGAGHHR
jgi:hypothetical protein